VESNANVGMDFLEPPVQQMIARNHVPRRETPFALLTAKVTETDAALKMPSARR